MSCVYIMSAVFLYIMSAVCVYIMSTVWVYMHPLGITLCFMVEGRQCGGQGRGRNVKVNWSNFHSPMITLNFPTLRLLQIQLLRCHHEQSWPHRWQQTLNSGLRESSWWDCSTLASYANAREKTF